MFKVFIGYDEREAVAYHVAVQSLIENTSKEISITPLRTDKLREQGLYSRPDDPRSSNAFSYTRFLVPALCGYKGQALYMDPDVIVKGDITQLEQYTEEAVYVVKHDYEPKLETKYFGARQYSYPCKNWSSVMLFNCERALITEKSVSGKSAEWLHRFRWTSQVGDLDKTWNWLVEEYAHNADAKILHYTNGIPLIDGFESTDHADDWWEYYRRMKRAKA